MRSRFIPLFILSFFFTFSVVGQNLSDEPQKDQWSAIDSLMNLGLIKTAEPQILEIYQKAKIENNIADYFKSLIYKIEISKTNDNFDINTVVDQLKDEIDETPSPQKQILHSILAEVYVIHLQQNQWNIKNRTDINSVLSKDINTWSENNYQEAIKTHFLLSIKDVELLFNTKIATIKAILKGNEKIRYLRPTLFDLLAHRLIEYFSYVNLVDEKTPKKLEENLDYFWQAEKFLNLKIDSTLLNNPKYFVLQMYQQLLSLHENAEDKSTFINCDLERLKFVKSYFLNKEKYEINYLNALNNIISSFPKVSTIAGVLYEKARVYTERGNRYDPFTSQEYQWEKQKAVGICNSVIKDFPESLAASFCQSMLTNLEAKNVNLKLKSVQLPGKSILASLDFKNCSELYFRIIPLHYKEEISSREYQRIRNRLSIYLKKEAVEEWSQNLPNKSDFQNHNVQIRIPELQKGYYILLLSASPDFNEKNLLHANYLWVSNLSFISRNDGLGGLDIFVHNRESGMPIQNVKLEIEKQTYNYKTRKSVFQKLATYFSDKAGYIHLSKQKNQYSKQFVFSYKNDILVEDAYRPNSYKIDSDRITTQTRFFTDRKIYRPGQTVYFKGIVVVKNHQKQKVSSNHKTKTVLYDANHQEVSSKEFISNEFGSFHGSFIIPDNVLNGNFQIKNENGSLSFSVEEYKRPNFEIRFDTLKTQYRINDTVVLNGIVKTYSGTTLGDAVVNYKISRSNYSYWDYDGRWFGGHGEQLTSGNIKTNDEGRFQIRFLAAANTSLNESLKMIYNYQIEVNVTDLNGETQSAEKRIPISYTNLKLSTNIPNYLDKNESDVISVSAVNFNGQKQDVNVSVSVFKLEQATKAFKNCNWNRPDQYVMDRETFYSYFPYAQYDDEKDLKKWKIENQVFQAEINTSEVKGFEINNLIDWENGVYKLILKTQDQYDEKIELERYFTLYSKESNKLASPDFSWFKLNADKVIPGDNCYFMIGSSAKNVSVLYELQQNNKVLKNKRFKLNREQKKIEIRIDRNYIGELNVNVVFIKDNEVYNYHKIIRVNDPKRELKISLETFRPLLQPGQNEEWKIKISGNNSKAVSAELLCSMTDISLETFRPNHWSFGFRPIAYNDISWTTHYGFGQGNGRILNSSYFGGYFSEIDLSFEDFFWNIQNLADKDMKRSFKGMIMERAFNAPPPPSSMTNINIVDEGVESEEDNSEVFMITGNKTELISQNTIKYIRTNFNETAFFYPDLQTDKEGNIILKFRSPEALTRWKFMALAHTKDLRSSILTQEIITQKDLMLSPNIPRFFRQGDTIFFNTKISNLSDEISKGKVELQFFDAENRQKIELIILDKNDIQDFEISKKSNITKSWKLLIPENVSALVYRLTASAKNHSDGEERMIPVLSNRMLVTESLPIHINANESKTMRFEKLLQSDSMKSIKHQSLKLEMTSNPNWYAIQALPQVAASNRKNAIALFNRFYANATASYILNSNPRIKQVFEQWKTLSPDAFLSNLEKNQELKSVLLDETPWLMEAKNENERKRRLAVFFDLNSMKKELNSSIEKLLKFQLYDGSWTWYKGGRGSRYITQHLLTGFLRLQSRGVLTSDQTKMLKEPIKNAIRFLNQKLKQDFEELKKQENIILDNDHLGNHQIQYLFALSYLDEAFELDEEMQTIFAYYLDQAQKYWIKRTNLQQGMIALILSRNADDETADLIMRSLKERSSSNEELGMYWKQKRGYYWYQAPIETQALLIEAFLEIQGDKKVVDEMKKWLIKQKQTQMWTTAKASVEAVNALFLEGINVLNATETVEVKLGGVQIGTEKQEAGTGYYEKHWNGLEVDANMGEIQLKNNNKQIAWGALHWQYFEDLDKITSHETPLKIEKQLFVRETTGILEALIPIDENRSLNVGDKVVSRIVIRVDRDMEFVHLKDMRASAFEPRNVLSRYRYQNGLGYYESTKDAATHFYFDRLRKGTYVFEYEMFVTQKGEFSNGITTIQCMYAPEFMSHSEGIRVVVSE